MYIINPFPHLSESWKYTLANYNCEMLYINLHNISKRLIATLQSLFFLHFIMKSHPQLSIGGNSNLGLRGVLTKNISGDNWKCVGQWHSFQSGEINVWSSAVKIPPMENIPVLMFCFTSIRWHHSSCTIKPNKNLIILEMKHANILTIYLPFWH